MARLCRRQYSNNEEEYVRTAGKPSQRRVRGEDLEHEKSKDRESPTEHVEDRLKVLIHEGIGIEQCVIFELVLVEC